MSTQQLNETVEGWSRQRADAMLANIRSLSIADTGRLFRSLRYRVHYDAGEADRISFKLQRYGIFVDVGAGKPRGYKAGNAKIPFETVKANRSRFRKQRPRPWFSQALTDASIAELANEVARHKANATVKSIKL